MSAQFSELSEDHQNALMHYGVPGMKWGKRKARTNGTGAGKLKGAERTKAIKTARKDIVENAAKYHAGEHQSRLGVTAQDRRKGREQANKALKTLEKMEREGKGELANKMTRGEKVVSGLLWGATGAMIVGSAYSTSR